MTRQTKSIISLGVLVVAVGYLMMLGFSKSATYYLTVGEALAKGAEVHERPIKVSGNIVDGSVKWDAKTIKLTFELGDGSKTLPVEYKGLRPDNFDDGREIVAEGRLEPSGTFKATQLIVRCPSKYEPEEPKK